MTKEEFRKLAYQKKNKIIKQHNKKIRRRVIGWNIAGAMSLMFSGYNLLDVCKTAMNYDQSKRFFLYAYIGFCVAQLGLSYYDFSMAREEKKSYIDEGSFEEDNCDLESKKSDDNSFTKKM